MGIAYRRTVAASQLGETSILAPLLSVCGHAVILPLVLTASIAVRELPRFDDFNLVGFAGGDVVEARVAQPNELAGEESAPEPGLVEEPINAADSVESASIEPVAKIEVSALVAMPDPAELLSAAAAAEPIAPATEAHSDRPAAPAEEMPLVPAVVSEPSTPAAVEAATAPQMEIEPVHYAASELASASYPLAERLALTALPVEPAEEKAIQDAMEVLEPALAEEPLEMASLAMKETSPPKSIPGFVPARKSPAPGRRSGEGVQRAALPFTAADRRLAQSSPELWQVVTALRDQVARCWSVAKAASGTPQFVDMEVAFDRLGRLKHARVQDAGRLLRDSAFSREARRARQALEACSPFALPSEHYGIWRHFIMRFMLSVS